MDPDLASTANAAAQAPHAHTAIWKTTARSRPHSPGHPRLHHHLSTSPRPLHHRLPLGFQLRNQSVLVNPPQRERRRYFLDHQAAAGDGRLVRMAKTSSPSTQSVIFSRAVTRHPSSAHPTSGLKPLPRSSRLPPLICRLVSCRRLKQARRTHFEMRAARSPRFGSYLGFCRGRNRQ